MNKENNEKRQQQLDQEKFNSVTQKVKPENQNQTHNAKKEGIAPKNTYK